MEKGLRILILEDVPADAELMEMELRHSGIEFISRRAETKEAFLEGLDDPGLSAVLADYYLPGFNAMEALQLVKKKKRSNLPFILVTGSQGEEVAVECIKAGMDDYILKSSLKRLPSALLKAMEKKEAERTQKRLISVMDSTPDFVGMVDRSGRTLYMNTAWRRLAGVAPEGGAPRFPAFESAAQEHAHVMEKAFFTAAREGRWSGENVLLGKNGREVPVSQVVIAHRGPDRQVEFFSIISRDISERKRAEKTIMHMAYHDPLTGLPNRLLLIDRLNQALSRGGAGRAAVLYLDLDRFKDINDTMGHVMGDELLKAVSERLTRCLRGGDTAARQGGDEFTVFLQRIERIDDVIGVIERIFSAFEPPFVLDGAQLFLTVSVGISVYPEDGDDAETLFKNADIALYQAKAVGRNTYKFFSKSMNEKIAKKIDIEGRLRRALAKGEFTLHYQPQVNVDTGKVIGMEALIRWKDPERGMVSPMDFIPVAEDTGLITPIGDWVLRAACRQGRIWIDTGIKPVCLGVNISMRQFRQKDFADTVGRALEEASLGPDNLELELTESILMEDVESVIGTLKKLKSMGIRLSIDDFGTGYSSLEYLKKMPIDTLKIAQQFVRYIDVNADDLAIATTIIRMGHAMSIDVIAEGVEKQAQLDLLKRMHCDKIQGYLISKPLSAEDARALLEGDRRFAAAPGGKQP